MTTVRLAIARHKINEVGQWGISWENNHLTLLDAELADKFFTTGATKQVYKVCLSEMLCFNDAY